MALHVRGVVLPEGDVRDLWLVGDRVTFEPVGGAETISDGGFVVPGLVDTARGPTPSAHAALPSLLGRRGRTDEIAAMVRYLSGPAARFITGQAIHVNGGAYMP